MPFNGSGTFTLAEPAFVPGTTIVSADMNSDLSDIASGLSECLTTDGQSTMTAQLKGFAGSVGAPGYSFSTDLNTGFYRIAADNLGVAVGGVKILDIASTGLSVTGTLATSDDLSVTGDITATGNISANGSIIPGVAQAVGMVNGTIAESHTGGAVTFAVKTLAGTDPSATNPVYLSFRNVTAATGNYSIVALTAALSLTVSAGSTLGAGNTRPFRAWLVVFNDGGTLRLGIINCLVASTTSPLIYPLRGFQIASSTAEGGLGGADSAAVFYTGTAVSSKAYCIIGYAGYESGLTTAGTWDVAPTRIQLSGSTTPLPGDVVQTLQVQSTTTGSTTSSSYAAMSSGITLDIAPSSAANLVEAMTSGGASASTNLDAGIQFARTVSAVTTVIGVPTGYTAGNNSRIPVCLGPFLDFPASTATCTYSLQAKTTAGTMSYPNNSAGAGGAQMTLKEIMA